MRPPILRHKDHSAASVFRAENLLREARRQKGMDAAPVPPVCLLDPDGDILRYLRGCGEARPCAAWSCYHSEMFEFDHAGQTIGIVACAVGAPYAVLLAGSSRHTSGTGAASASGLAAHELISGSELHRLPIEDQDVPIILFEEWQPHEAEITEVFAGFMRKRLGETG